MPVPSPGYSVTIRLEIENTPGMLGKVTTAVGNAGGDIRAVDLVRVEKRHLVRDITINARDEDHEEAVKKAIEEVAGVRVIASSDRVFLAHLGGKIEVRSKLPLKTRDDLSISYTPGVARVCRAIQKDPAAAFNLTIRKNTVAVVSDGSSVLGLGNLGAVPALPVMEGKAQLLKEFAGVDAFPIVLSDQTVDGIVQTVKAIALTFGGINLEDIAAPKCFEIEDRLRAELDIPVFHDDQHGTAVVVLAALLNALKIVGKRLEDVGVVVCGVGAAGVAITKILLSSQVRKIVGVDVDGIIHRNSPASSPIHEWYARHTNPNNLEGGLREAIVGADVFIGVSRPNLLTVDDLRKMASDPVVFALANPDPEISPEEAEGAAAVMATGRSDYANQINNVLAFPGVFRGALDSGAREITEGMKLAAARAIAGLISDSELTSEYIIPSVFDPRVAPAVAAAVAATARKEKVARRGRPAESSESA